MPWRAWPEFERAFAGACTRLNYALDAYEANFDSIWKSVLTAFRQLAGDSVRRLEATGQPVSIEFADVIVRGVLNALPTPETLRQKLSLRYRVGVMQLGSEFWAEQRASAEERRRLELVQEDRRLDLQRRAVDERLVQERLWSEQQRLRQQRLAEEQDLQREAAIKEQLRQLKLQAARDRLQEALSPLEEGAQQLHAVVFEAASALRSSLQKNQALRGSSARKARDLCRWFGLMNWTGDRQLEQLIAELEQLATAPTPRARKRDPKPIDQVLADIIALTNDGARSALEPNRMAGLEL